MKLLSALSVLALSLTACTNQSANAQKIDTPDSTSAAAVFAPAQQLVVAELFTSQGCSSCPSAEKLFSSLADREDLLTLEWHVDYWDDLVHHGSRWKDPYSKREFTERQRSYNQLLRGKRAAYTPQAVVNGQAEGVGSRSGTVNNMVANVAALSVPVQITNDKVVIGPSAEAADILFVRLLERHETNVKGGENKGRKLSGRNIVLEAAIIGKAGSKTTELSLPSVGAGETCAVLVQNVDGGYGPVMGAARCGEFNRL